MKKDLTYKLRKNPYIVSTFVLALFCLLIVVGNIIEAKSIDGTENLFNLEREKQLSRSEILNDYLTGKITKEQGIQKLEILSCEIAKQSGVKYNVGLCYGT